MSLSHASYRLKLIILAIVGLFYSLSIAYLLPHLSNQFYGNDFFARWYASKMLLTTGRGLYDLLMGPVLIILLNSLALLYPVYVRWMLRAIVVTFIGGMLAFVIPLLISGPNGWHITSAEIIYRFTLPVGLSLISLTLLITKPAVVPENQTSNQSAILPTQPEDVFS